MNHFKIFIVNLFTVGNIFQAFSLPTGILTFSSATLPWQRYELVNCKIGLITSYNTNVSKIFEIQNADYVSVRFY